MSATAICFYYPRLFFSEIIFFFPILKLSHYLKLSQLFSQHTSLIFFKYKNLKIYSSYSPFLPQAPLNRFCFPIQKLFKFVFPLFISFSIFVYIFVFCWLIFSTNLFVETQQYNKPQDFKYRHFRVLLFHFCLINCFFFWRKKCSY